MKPSDPLFPPLAPPKGDPTARERALHRAVIALRQPPSEPLTLPVASVRYRFAWVGGGLMLLLTALLGLSVGQWRGESESLATLAKTLHEFEALFPRQLNAIVEKQGEVELDLAPAPDASAAQPVYVKLKKGFDSVQILSYSGRSITVMLGEKRLTFELLITGNGEVILLGDDFIWPGAESPFRVKACPLFPS